MYCFFAGLGVTVYVVDSGVEVNHPNLGTRASYGYTAIELQARFDTNGHGTHVAGIIPSESFGVASWAKLTSVKVLDSDGEGSAATVLDGLSYVLYHITHRPMTTKNVVSLALSTPKFEQFFIWIWFNHWHLPPPKSNNFSFE